MVLVLTQDGEQGKETGNKTILTLGRSLKKAVYSEEEDLTARKRIGRSSTSSWQSSKRVPTRGDLSGTHSLGREGGDEVPQNSSWSELPDLANTNIGGLAAKFEFQREKAQYFSINVFQIVHYLLFSLKFQFSWVFCISSSNHVLKRTRNLCGAVEVEHREEGSRMNRKDFGVQVELNVTNTRHVLKS